MTVRIKSISRIIFYISFFLQAFIDGFYISHGQNPTTLKVLKYGFFLMGVIVGILSKKKKLIYHKETYRLTFAIAVIFVISLMLCLVNNGSLTAIFELTFRYLIAILYAFIILNMFTLDEIYQLMVYILFVSLGGWLLEKGSNVFSLNNFNSISFFNSSSPFESSYFAAPSINCCAFFMYYRKNKIISLISFTFVLLTFKRPAIVFAFIFFIIPLLIDVNKEINKKMVLIYSICLVMLTCVWYNLMLPENSELFYRIFSDTQIHFTQGRSALFQRVISSGYHAAGLGSSQFINGRIIEMDLLQILLETTFVGLFIFVFAYVLSAGRKRYTILLITFHMFTCLTGSGLYNTFGWVPVFMTFGSINYLQREDFKQLHFLTEKLRFIR